MCRRGSYDRKKKIIQEWNKTNKSPRAAETLTSGGPAPASYLAAPHELFPSYNPYVKDEPLRADYYPYYSDLVNPYAHMGARKEKRKKHDSIPGNSKEISLVVKFLAKLIFLHSSPGLFSCSSNLLQEKNI